MKINSARLREFMLSLVRAHFGSRSFERPELMDLTEQEIRGLDLWSNEDDQPSLSTGTKSKGLAFIDYRFSDLVKKHAFIKIEHGVWKLKI